MSGDTVAEPMITKRFLVLGATLVVAGLRTMAQNLFEANVLTGSVWEFGPGGQVITSTFGVPLEIPQGLAFDTSGNLYVAYGLNVCKVAKFGPTGNLINDSFASVPSSPAGMTFDSSGLEI